MTIEANNPARVAAFWQAHNATEFDEGDAASLDARVELINPMVWAEFSFPSLFRMEKGKRVTKADRRPGQTRHVSASAFDNGVTDLCDLTPNFEGHCISVALDGSVGEAFYQEEPFFASDHIIVLRPLMEISRYSMLFLCAVIRHEAWRYSFGYAWNLKRMKASTLRLPATVCGQPDLEYMDRYMRGLPFSTAVDSMLLPTIPLRFAAPSDTCETPLSDTSSWRKFELPTLFRMEKGKRVTKADRKPGATRFIGASDRNNGVTDMCDLTPNFDAHCLTVPYNGSVGAAFYQDEPFFASDDVTVLTPISDESSREALLFVAAIIRHEARRFGFGYKWNLARMRESSLHLPINGDGAPDWEYMDRYMRGLPFSAAAVDTDQSEGSEYILSA